MEKIRYEKLNETLYVDRLDNGLTVYVLPKSGFQKTYATFATRYGSIDNHFRVEGKEEVKVPDGIAHFLEHKMFEEPSGDIFATFASQGASANAFTSFDRTVYLFSATGQIEENLTTLVNFVQNPYFTDENVEKEKGIIGQEIKMYEDHPDWRVYFGLIEAMYHTHPVRIDIAGTVQSISQITKETLYECYHTFYHPSNMSLFIVGGVNPEQIFQWVRDNQQAKTFADQGSIHRYFPVESAEVKEHVKTTILPVSEPKCMFGFKEPSESLDGAALLRKELVTKVMMDLLFSQSSAVYQTLYDENLISDSFGYNYNCTPEYSFSMIGGDTPDPDKLLQRVEQLLKGVLKEGISKEDFERSRKKKIGGYLRMLNSPEAMANQFTAYLFMGSDFFSILPIYEEMTLEEVNQRLADHFQWDRMAVSIVRKERG
ncbi:EF-P 5-aminopentanol modification-associated protein YfmH [Paenibacillus sp. J2TS4]|uniref:EF-P 5-aminopentanol modification-associated protein YfmH n=1 Tax=Paenibacillus sp. J2TS4 TaxID=2807194 RepID=UPI001AFD4A4F|nr:pitrilysin family protein [Paenibacillus sp. J2TS4]GIP33135.1 peptidase M16 [Paenibacillus sp. J2TS4]